VQSGTATARIHYRIEGDRLTAEHDVDFKGLKVERAPESAQQKNRIGLPLGLAVSLLKDSRGDIDFSVPLNGTWSDRNFDWGEAMWSGVKQVLVKVLAAPFNAIGRVFTGGGDQTPTKFEIDPVTFEPGSSVLVPDMERQITRIADFLRRSPYVRLRLSTVATEADVQSLKTLAVTRRLDQFRKDNGLADAASTLRAYYQRHATDLTLPKTVEEQVARLVAREPAPAEALADLGRRRLDATRERLSKAEGIPAERLEVPEVVPASDAAATGSGRVEFSILAEAG